MQLDRTKLILWIAVLLCVVACLGFWRHHKAAEVATPPAAQTDPYAGETPMPPSKPQHSARPARPNIHKRPLDIRTPPYRPHYRPRPRGGKVDCNQLPAGLSTVPWSVIEAGARSRHVSAEHIAELKICLGA